MRMSFNFQKREHESGKRVGKIVGAFSPEARKLLYEPLAAVHREMHPSRLDHVRGERESCPLVLPFGRDADDVKSLRIQFLDQPTLEGNVLDVERRFLAAPEHE